MWLILWCDVSLCFFFFFKQKTAYEMRISDWSSDVCSSDLVVLSKALQDSADHFLKFGNLDIDHKSMPSVARQYGIADPESWEIGLPTEVRFKDGVTFVKAKLFSGDTPLAARANMVWDRMTRLNPPRSDERRAGKESVSSCRYLWSPDH